MSTRLTRFASSSQRPRISEISEAIIWLRSRPDFCPALARKSQTCTSPQATYTMHLCCYCIMICVPLRILRFIRVNLSNFIAPLLPTHLHRYKYQLFISTAEVLFNSSAIRDPQHVLLRYIWQNPITQLASNSLPGSTPTTFR